QLLYGLRYHIHINTAEEATTFHDQVGYWLWEPATGLIMQTIAIPRAQVVLAGGTAKPDDERISVEARRGDTRFGICSTPFLEQAFRTDYYRIDITFNDDGSWSYVTRTDLAVRGTTPAFDHRDTNTLRRIALPQPNPLVDLLKAGKPAKT
ncbi:MAG TPA: heme-binding beta-barrel domain-containing protein, partial [Candidatus Polarisedimenticolia bacterium]|nr:heme-binding beta-barrel domain-containing protein [Candidatus Polarisedimenticolia bacterium]